MLSIREEILSYINHMSDEKLEALKPLMNILINTNDIYVDTNLTEEEKDIIQKGREEYNNGDYVSLDEYTTKKALK